MHIHKFAKPWPDGTVEERSYVDLRETSELDADAVVQITTGHDANGRVLWRSREVIRRNSHE